MSREHKQGEVDPQANLKATIESLAGSSKGRTATYVAFIGATVAAFYTVFYQLESLNTTEQPIHTAFAALALFGAATATMDLCKLIRDHDIAERRVRLFSMNPASAEIQALKGTDANAALVRTKVKGQLPLDPRCPCKLFCMFVVRRHMRPWPLRPVGDAYHHRFSPYDALDVRPRDRQFVHPRQVGP